MDDVGSIVFINRPTGTVSEDASMAFTSTPTVIEDDTSHNDETSIDNRVGVLEARIGRMEQQIDLVINLLSRMPASLQEV